MTRRSSHRARLAAALLTGLAAFHGEAAPNPADPQWVVLDAALHRSGDRASIERQGPWVQFLQRWEEIKWGQPADTSVTEKMAVNCLTGAFGQTQYPATDPQTHKSILKQQSFSEIEHAQVFDARLLLKDNSTALGRALMEFACSCDAPDTATSLDQSDIQSAYDRYMAEPLSKVEYHLKFLRVKSEHIALQAIAELAAGKPFETVFDQYASASDAASFPHGDLGAHLESEFTIEDVRRFRGLRIGEVSRIPHDGLYGWEVEQLASKRSIAAPSLAAMQPRLRDYLARAHACGWAP